MSTFQVHDPKPGWETRWLRQAAVLAFRNGPLCLALLAMMIVPGFVANRLGVRFVSFRILMETAAWSTFVILPFCVWMARSLLRGEGYAMTRFGASDLRTLGPLMLRSGLVFTGMFLVVFLLERLAGEEGDPSTYFSTLSLLAIPALLGTRPCMFLMAHAAMGDWNRTDMDQVALQAAAVFDRRVWRPARFAILSALGLCLVTPFIVAGPLAVIMFFWFYVAAREIFGGVDGNREASFRTSLALAADSA